jgi:hypothetical protein
MPLLSFVKRLRPRVDQHDLVNIGLQPLGRDKKRLISLGPIRRNRGAREHYRHSHKNSDEKNLGKTFQFQLTSNSSLNFFAFPFSDYNTKIARFEYLQPSGQRLKSVFSAKIRILKFRISGGYIQIGYPCIGDVAFKFK